MPTTARRLRWAAALILALGLAAALVAYLAAPRPADDATGYRIVGGQAYGIDASTAQTERMGGQALVMTARFDRWFGSLWHGERLAWTLATLAIGGAALCWYVAGLAAEDDG